MARAESSCALSARASSLCTVPCPHRARTKDGCLSVKSAWLGGIRTTSGARFNNPRRCCHCHGANPTPALVQETPSSSDLLAAFEVFDQTGNGYMSLSELTHVMKNLGEGMDDAMIEKMKVVCEPDKEDQV